MHQSLQGQTQSPLAQQHNDGHQQRERQTDRQQIIHRKGLLVTEGEWGGRKAGGYRWSQTAVLSRPGCGNSATFREA
jgi:hypothetical protein